MAECAEAELVVGRLFSRFDSHGVIREQSDRRYSPLTSPDWRLLMAATDLRSACARRIRFGGLGLIVLQASGGVVGP